jgi:hypothetical protein
MRIFNSKAKRYSKHSFCGVFLECVNETVKKYTSGGRIIRFISNRIGVDENSFIEFDSVKIMPKLKKFRNEDISSVVRELTY